MYLSPWYSRCVRNVFGPVDCVFPWHLQGKCLTFYNFRTVCHGLPPNLSTESICRRTFSRDCEMWVRGNPASWAMDSGPHPSIPSSHLHIFDGNASSWVFALIGSRHQSSAINANYCPKQAAAVVILPAGSSSSHRWKGFPVGRWVEAVGWKRNWCESIGTTLPRRSPAGLPVLESNEIKSNIN